MPKSEISGIQRAHVLPIGKAMSCATTLRNHDFSSITGWHSGKMPTGPTLTAGRGEFQETRTEEAHTGISKVEKLIHPGN
jgi:hypothetical protein